MKIICPTHIVLPMKTKKDKNISLTLNWYSTAHYHEKNKIKKMFKEIIRPQVEWKVFDEPYWITLEVFYKRISDLDNWDSICSKFLNDAIVELWCVSDDNMLVLIEKHATVGWKDTKNPRIEATII